MAGYQAVRGFSIACPRALEERHRRLRIESASGRRLGRIAGAVVRHWNDWQVDFTRNPYFSPSTRRIMPSLFVRM
jgi:hypothetical protein